LTSVRYKLQDSGFYFDNTFASILTGTEEAGYGFLAVNTLENSLVSNSEDHQTYGSLDMGGVSSEIAFISSSSPPNNYTFNVEINGTTYTVYAQSNDGLGINEARYSLNVTLYLNSTGNIVQDPCVPSGYYENVTINIGGNDRSFLLMGSSTAEACRMAVQGWVHLMTDKLPVPPVTGTFVVADHYIDVKNFFKLKENANILELEAKVSSFCNLNYGDAMAHHDHYANEVQYYCFMGTYVATLLRNYYGFNPTMRHILWHETIHKSPVTWALGYMVNDVQLLVPDTTPQSHTRRVRFYETDGGVVSLFIACLFAVLGVVLYALQRHHHRVHQEYVEIR